MRIRTTLTSCLANMLLVASVAAAADDLSLLDAVKNGDAESVARLLASGVDVDQPSADGSTALAHAAYRNDLETLELLLYKGEAKVNTVNDYGATALYLAAANADPGVIERLLRSRADPDVGLLSGETPLMVAANRGRVEAARLLLEHDANVNASETRGGQTALMWAVAQRHARVVSLLIEHGADVNARSKSGFTPLLFAARQGDGSIAESLLKAGARIDDSVTKSGLTPLMIASLGGFTNAATVLIEHGANIDAVDKDGKTVLHHAVRFLPTAAIVRELLSRGANPNVRLQSPKEYEGYAVDPQDSTPLLQAAGLGNLDAVVALLEAGADAKIATANNTNALMMAAGANLPAESAASPAQTANSTEIARLLLPLGFDVNAVGEYGWTALHSAAYHGRNEIVKDLIDHGANTEILDSFGQTPLSIANAIVTRGLGDDYRHTPRSFRRETTEILLAMGATPLEQSGVDIVTARASVAE